MQDKVKQAYVEEIQYQTKMLNNLKIWLRNMIILSSISLILILCGESISSFLPVIGIVLMVLSVIACFILSLGIKNGYNNINKIINYIEK